MRRSSFRMMTRQAGVVVPLSALAIYLLVFLIVPSESKSAATSLSILPVIAVAWTLGLRAGVLAAVFTIPLNTALMNVAGQPGWDALLRTGGGVLGTIALVAAGAAVGRLSDLWGRLEKEVSERQRIEEALRERTAKLSEASERLASLNDASRVLGVASTDPDQVRAAIHQAITRLMPAEVFCITIVDHERAKAEDVYTAGIEKRRNTAPYAVAGTFVDHMFRRGKSLRIDDVQHLSDEADPFDGYLEADTRSTLAVLLPGSDNYMGVLVAQCNTCAAYSAEDEKMLEMLAAHAATAIENAQLYQAAQRVAADEERQRLARQLHDSVTQSLYSLTLMTNGWAALSEQGELKDAAGSFRQLEELGIQALREMRLLIHQLRPPLLEEVGLVGAVQERLETVEHRVGVDTQLLTEGHLERLPVHLEEELLHITHEALNNVLRHADADHIIVHLSVEDGSARLAIQDDGRGFDSGATNGGLGLVSMRERVESVGGEFNIESVPGKGTTIEVSVAI